MNIPSSTSVAAAVSSALSACSATEFEAHLSRLEKAERNLPAAHPAFAVEGSINPLRRTPERVRLISVVKSQSRRIALHDTLYSVQKVWTNTGRNGGVMFVSTAALRVWAEALGISI
ncbi:MAG: hypothetical protein U1F10_00540 [Burkholderiales bacterium]